MDSAASSSNSQNDQSVNSAAFASLGTATLDASPRMPAGFTGATSTSAGNNIGLFQREHGAMDRVDLEMLLRLESIRNAELQAQQTRFTQDDNLSNNFNSDSFNVLSANIMQQYVKQQQQQQQNILANQLHQLQQPHLHQHLLDSARLQPPNTGIMGNFSTAGLAVGSSTSNVMGYAQRFQAPYNHEREQLLAALLSNVNDNSWLLQNSNFPPTGENPAQLFSSNTVPSSAQLLDRSYHSQYAQQQQAPMFPGANTSHFAAGIQTAVISSRIPQNSSNEGAAADRKRDAEEQTPVRALSAYNFFFRYERERILNSNADDIEARPNLSQEKQKELLESHWGRDRTVKRRHRKSHGKISFAELSKRISQRWKDLPEDQKNFFAEVAAKDWERYHQEVEQQKRLGQLPVYKKSRP
jgi:HMG (high mobility group) box